ncbi:hypothetical protein SERLADRAFT_436463 [Serpula lacrymans var. lacrymans S7.9]|uniref:HAT C-terminal dimerisation domain-containing protein n=1 Tax=Serpula lacrymans var. lacrymans (strain S7.9) TaxID=578457 RepID=F8NQV3_SERL9|nr:uncharacterized protein SERLADRAFT_436463 [Serpula lacrymans var. lacrymans S7.9]EGO26656.1 hypothetical protein SERLADRAFT_436463 [Serpula lacrymans var. lacrymans S7.9]
MRFYKEEAPIQLYCEVVSYLSNQDRYGKLPDHIRRETALAASENKSVDPMSIYIAMTNLVNPLPTPLERLARHLLTVSANSASCERLFSAFGLILTRLCSRMSIKLMTDLAELQLHLRDEHVHLGILKKKLRKRQILSMSTNDFTLGEAEPASNPGHPPDNSNSEAEALHSPSSTCRNSMDDIIIGLHGCLDADEDPEVVTFGQIHVSVTTKS